MKERPQEAFAASPLQEKLQAVNADQLTPREALDLIYQLKELL
jgi:DNA mismatch repair ATPase MutS